MTNTMEIRPIERLNAVVQVPASKSYTQRALVIAALAEGRSFLSNPLISEDTEYLMNALCLLGAEIHSSGKDVIVAGTGGKINSPGRSIYLGNNGTAMRFLLAVASLGAADIRLTGARRLCERPVMPLLNALRGIGVSTTCEGRQGCPPVIIRAAGIRGGRAVFHDIESSQYVSAMMISAPFAVHDVEIEVHGTVASRPYIDMTMDVMQTFGVSVGREREDHFLIRSGQRYRGSRYVIEGDVSSASYFFLAAALCHGTVRVADLNPGTLQGDIQFLRVLEKLGCAVIRGTDWVEVTGKDLHPGEFIFDMGDMPDMVPTLAVLSAVRIGRTVIRNTAHLRIKESNRLEALAQELVKTGIRAEETDDGLVIEGGMPHGAEISTYNDHRIAMSFAMLGLAVCGVRIRDRNCVRKSFPGFWKEMKKLYP